MLVIISCSFIQKNPFLVCQSLGISRVAASLPLERSEPGRGPRVRDRAVSVLCEVRGRRVTPQISTRVTLQRTRHLAEAPKDKEFGICGGEAGTKMQSCARAQTWRVRSARALRKERERRKGERETLGQQGKRCVCNWFVCGCV